MIVLVLIHSPFAMWNIPRTHVTRLETSFPQHRFLNARDDREGATFIAEADVAFSAHVRPEQLAAARRLRWIHSPAAGVGSMLYPEMVRSPVVITNSRGMSADTIAEHALAVTLALFRRLPVAMRRQSQRRWAQDEIGAPPSNRLVAGSRVLVVGLGAIGAATAARFAALGARVSAVRRRPGEERPAHVHAVGGPDRLREFLAQADVVVLSAPETPGTRHLIGAPEIACMKPDAILVNVSRGKLVDEGALTSALVAGRLGGAALDVFEQEPLDAGSPLWSLPGALITPHTAGFRPDHWDAATELFAENLTRFEAGQSLRNLVDKEQGY